MPFPFTLPTTSQLSFQSHLTSSTHPSLPATATSYRTALRSALKTYKHAAGGSAPSQDLSTLLSALNTYLPYLLTLDAGLSGHSVSGEEIDVALTMDVEVEWRPTLSTSNLPGREAARVKGNGLDYEIHSVLQTLATVHNLLARQALIRLYASTTPTSEQRLASIQTALSHLRAANSIHLYLIHRTHSASLDGSPTFPSRATDVLPTVQSALAELSLAEATLLLVLKDDPYPAVVVQSRNKNDKEWMIKAPELPKVRAHLFARLCLSAAEHASLAASNLRAESGQTVSGDVGKYCEDLRRTSRARACRFFAVDADLGGKTGEAIAWLHGGLSEVGHEVPTTTNGVPGSASKSSSTGGISRLKSSWNERKEDKRLAKGLSEAGAGGGGVAGGVGKRGEWGADAGKLEEGRVLSWLEARFARMNDTINVQLVPEWKPLLATMPSGREGVKQSPWIPSFLAEDDLSRMRAPPNVAAGMSGLSLSDDDDGEYDQPNVTGNLNIISADDGEDEYVPRDARQRKQQHYALATGGEGVSGGSAPPPSPSSSSMKRTGGHHGALGPGGGAGGSNYY